MIITEIIMIKTVPVSVNCYGCKREYTRINTNTLNKLLLIFLNDFFSNIVIVLISMPQGNMVQISSFDFPKLSDVQTLRICINVYV